MRVFVSFGSYNPRRHSRPWIAKITAWPVGGSQELEWGGYVGDDSGGEAEIEAAPGDVIRWGQKDYRKPRASTAFFGRVLEDGTVEELSAREARETFVAANHKAVG